MKTENNQKLPTREGLVPDLLTESEASVILKLPKDSLRRLRWSGGGPPFIRLPGGRLIRYDLADLTNWIEQGRRTSTTDNGGAA